MVKIEEEKCIGCGKCVQDCVRQGGSKAGMYSLRALCRDLSDGCGGDYGI